MHFSPNNPLDKVVYYVLYDQKEGRQSFTIEKDPQGVWQLTDNVSRDIQQSAFEFLRAVVENEAIK